VSKTYYLFQTDKDGTIVAMDRVIGLSQVKKRLLNLPAALKQSQYLVYDPAEAKVVEPFKKSA
jgi:hypothetical protein